MNILSKTPAHSGMSMDKLMRLSGEVEDTAVDGLVSAEAMDELSSDLGIPCEQLYAGLGMSSAANLQLQHDVQFVVCTGACQNHGALAVVSELLALREDRIDNGDAAFDVVPRPCLNRCQNGAVVEIRSADGTAILGKATPASVTEAVDTIFADV